MADSAGRYQILEAHIYLPITYLMRHELLHSCIFPLSDCMILDTIIDLNLNLPFECAMLFDEIRIGMLIGSTSGVFTLVPVAEISGLYHIPYRNDPTA
jgi:hypothetical protein